MPDNTDVEAGASGAHEPATSDGTTQTVDPRALLSEWANENDEWVRHVVGEVLSAGTALGESGVAHAYALFRQEKALDERTLPSVAPLDTVAKQDEAAAPLTITKLSDVQGVNALTPGSVIEPHAGLTILFGENGTGKTGYSRIFKALAASRTADEILGDIAATEEEPPSARVTYKLGDQQETLEWAGEIGVSPFTRMSIFDSPSVSYHVDDDLDYVYVPAALALFNHVIAGLRGVQGLIDQELRRLNSGATSILSRIPREASVYPIVETLGASTDLVTLKAQADWDPQASERVESLRQAVAALQANTLGPEISLRQHEVRVLQQATLITQGMQSFSISEYNGALTKRAQLQADYQTFRSELFAAADLPAEPDETWSDFIAAGDEYQQHLTDLGVHDAGRCLYCRQTLSDPARELLGRYATYLEDKISDDIRAIDRDLSERSNAIRLIANTEVQTLVEEYQDRADKPEFYADLRDVSEGINALKEVVGDRQEVPTDSLDNIGAAAGRLVAALATTQTTLGRLQEQSGNRTTALAEKRIELNELVASSELARSWAAIEEQVNNAKEADRLQRLRTGFPVLSRSITELSKRASDELINHSFDTLFAEECDALRAPSLKVEFVGRQGRAQRRKVLSGKHRPSKVLSEGEQKVLAIADFLAEARLAGITAPVIFDDPVSSLDYRRLNEVAQRIVGLAEAHQAIVFTHDIFLATTLLSLMEASGRCSYFQITDEGGKGKVIHATGPRWDTLKSIRTRINVKIQAAQAQEGEARAALIRTAYNWIRSWCEVFTETELLRGVSQRYQPNIGMTRLYNINTAELPGLIERVGKVFEDACRYIDGHSQPLPTLAVSPTLEGLEADWAELLECKKLNDG